MLYKLCLLLVPLTIFFTSQVIKEHQWSVESAATTLTSNSLSRNFVKTAELSISKIKMFPSLEKKTEPWLTLEKKSAELTNINKKKQVNKPKVVRRIKSRPISTAKINKSVYQIGYEKCLAHWDNHNCQDFMQLVSAESGWNINAVNPHSGACGLFQALPCSKLGSARGNVHGEIDWGIGYISARYRNPSNALRLWQARNPHWY